MKSIRDFIKKYTNNQKQLLGRWNIDYCNKKLDKKIDLSNEDHCGPCGQYILSKKTDEIQPKIKVARKYKIKVEKRPEWLGRTSVYLKKDN